MTENLNCKTCGQNVMVSGLKNVNSEWKCRTCIKNEGVTLQTVNAIGQYDFLEERLKQRDEHLEKVFNTPNYNKYLNKLIKPKQQPWTQEHTCKIRWTT